MGRCECGFSYDDVAVRAIAERLPLVVDDLCEEVAREPDPNLQRRSAPEVWSPLEYCCHVRDVLIVQRERVVRALVEECPTVPPMHRDERAVLLRYADEEPARVLDQLRVASRLCCKSERRAHGLRSF